MRKRELRERVARQDTEIEFLRGELGRWMDLAERERRHSDLRIDRMLSFIMSPDLAALHARADQLEAEVEHPPPTSVNVPEAEPTLSAARIEAELRARGVTDEELVDAAANVASAGS